MIGWACSVSASPQPTPNIPVGGVATVPCTDRASTPVSPLCASCTMMCRMPDQAVTHWVPRHLCCLPLLQLRFHRILLSSTDLLDVCPCLVHDRQHLLAHRDAPCRPACFIRTPQSCTHDIDTGSMESRWRVEECSRPPVSTGAGRSCFTSANVMISCFESAKYSLLHAQFQEAAGFGASRASSVLVGHKRRLTRAHQPPTNATRRRCACSWPIHRGSTHAATR